MIEAPHYSPTGAKKSAGFALPETFFDGTVNRPVIHEAVKAYLANQRQGTASTKTRALVSGGNQKPWKQKGTGRARQGSIRAPHWPGGGTVFGPQPRDYRIELPKKVKQLARRSALNARVAEGKLFVVEQFQQQHPRTRELVGLLEALGVADRKVLVLTHGVSQALVLSARNLPRVDVLTYADASAYDVIWSDVVVVEEGALAGVEPEVPVRVFVPAPRTEKHTASPRVKAAKTAKPKAESKAKAQKKAAKPAKAEKKPAAKKPAAKAAPRAKAAKKPAAKHGPSKGEGKAAPKKKGGK